MANFCTAWSFPFALPSWRVVTVTFDSTVDEGAYLNDLTLPSSSPVEDVRRGRAGEMYLRSGESSDGGGLTATVNTSQA
jgi:hypothetical protein